MQLIKRILILEDNLLVLSKILDRLYILEGDQPFDLCLTTLTDHKQVESLLNTRPGLKFDIILLDGDDKLNHTFHVLDIEHFGVEKVIAISSISQFNEQLKNRGVTRVVEKDLSDIEGFADNVTFVIKGMISKRF